MNIYIYVFVYMLRPDRGNAPFRGTGQSSARSAEWAMRPCQSAERGIKFYFHSPIWDTRVLDLFNWKKNIHLLDFIIKKF